MYVATLLLGLITYLISFAIHLHNNIILCLYFMASCNMGTGDFPDIYA